ncbi:MAG TPA: MFS transporter [Rubricoccaceae bacterium]|nr:MFS transporter [Rubricoccaceae bacterium]
MSTVHRSRLTRTVWALGVVSLLADLASDMVFPLLPAFLVGVLGASATGLGLIEGVAEGTSAALKLVAGRLADRTGRLKGLTLLGYAVSGAAKPLVALATAPWHVLAVRFGDRVGKGLRSAPRDALLALEAPPEARGRAFGLHRAMDTAGAMLGPLVAFGVLALAPGDYRLLFALSAVPAGLSVLVLVLFVSDRRVEGEMGDGRWEMGRAEEAGTPSPAPLGAPFWKLLAVVAIFTLGNSSDAFALLRAEGVGVPVAALPILWFGFNAVYTAVAYVGGGWSDRAGRRRVLVAGLVVYALAYGGFALAGAVWHVLGAFALYGVYYGLTEGVLRAAVSDVVPAERRGTAFGVYYALTGVLALVASLGAGWLWDAFGPAVPFGAGAALALVAAMLATRWVRG